MLHGKWLCELWYVFFHNTLCLHAVLASRPLSVIVSPPASNVITLQLAVHVDA